MLDTKVVREIVQELKVKVRKNTFSSNICPKLVFLCGEQILDENSNIISRQQAPDNKRFYIMDKLNKYKNKDKKSIVCVISEVLYEKEQGIDILSFEELLGELSEEIIILVESFGTACELGAFAVGNKFLDKLTIINEDRAEYKESFITKGPIKKIYIQNNEKVIKYEGGYVGFKNNFQLNHVLQDLAFKEIKIKPNLDAENIIIKYLIYEMMNLIEIFQPITEFELMYLYKKIKDFDKYKFYNEKAHHIKTFNDVVNLMEKLEIIDKKSGFIFLKSQLTSYNTLFNLSKNEFNELRIKFLCKIYKEDINRAKVIY